MADVRRESISTGSLLVILTDPTFAAKKSMKKKICNLRGGCSSHALLCLMLVFMLLAHPHRCSSYSILPWTFSGSQGFSLTKTYRRSSSWNGGRHPLVSLVSSSSPSSSSALHVTRTPSHHHEPNTEVDLSTHDDRESKELNWLVVTTGKLIGENALPVGGLSKFMVFETHRCMRAWSRRSSRPKSNAPYVVEQLLHRLIQEQHAGNPHVLIDTRTYNVVIDSWSKSRERGSAKRAEEILMGMEKQYEDGNKNVRPNRESFNNAIKCWVRNGNNKEAVAKAEALMDFMSELSQRDTSVLPPCRRGYNLLLYAYAHSGLVDAGERADAVLKKMKSAGMGDQSIAPDINTYNLVLKAWGQSNTGGFDRRAQTIFDEVMDLSRSSSDIIPNFETFNAMLSSCIKSTEKSAMNRILEILEIMERMYNEGNGEAKPDRVTVNSVMTAFAKRGEVEQVLHLHSRMEDVYNVAPDTVSNNILIDAWSKTGRREAPERALEILTQMEEDYKKGNAQVKPDKYSYTSVIDCFVKADSSQSGRQARSLLDRMLDLHLNHDGHPPSTDCYNAVLNSFASARTKDSADAALTMLSEMEEKSKQSNSAVPKPDRVTYNTCLKACRNGDNEYAGHAEHLLIRMIELGENDPSLVPDSYTYAAVINVLGRSQNVDKAERVLRVMNQMIQSYKAGTQTTKPSTHVFNAALNACAYSRYDDNAKTNAFVISVSILLLLQQYATPDDVTYGTVLRACSNLLPKSDKRRDELVEKVFLKASKEGQVSEMVLSQLQFAASERLFQQLVGFDLNLNLTLDDLPREWARKVKRKTRKDRWTV